MAVEEVERKMGFRKGVMAKLGPKGVVGEVGTV